MIAEKTLEAKFLVSGRLAVRRYRRTCELKLLQLWYYSSASPERVPYTLIPTSVLQVKFWPNVLYTVLYMKKNVLGLVYINLSFLFSILNLSILGTAFY